MKHEETPEEIFSQIEGGKQKLLERKTVTQSSARVDEGVRTLEDKVIGWQEIINYWRSEVARKQTGITSFCIILGCFFSLAVNRCTGNLDISPPVYALCAALLLAGGFLLIADGPLRLIVLVKFTAAAFFGHYLMMWVISIDGHTWGLFTSDICRYPISIDVSVGVVAGTLIGYIWKSFEEIRAARGK